MLKLGRKILSFRKRIVAIVVGVTMVTLSLLFTNDMARRLREKEQHEVALWVHAMERVMSDSSNDPFVQDILSQRNNIPFMLLSATVKSSSSISNSTLICFNLFDLSFESNTILSTCVVIGN